VFGWHLAFGTWLLATNLGLDNLKIMSRENIQIVKFTNQRINPDLPPMLFIHG
jgi:hypothetical protein